MAGFERTHKAWGRRSKRAVDDIHIALYHALTGCRLDVLQSRLCRPAEQDSRLACGSLATPRTKALCRDRAS